MSFRSLSLQFGIGGNRNLGNVRTDQVKRTAKELVRRFPGKFSTDFEANKLLVGKLIQGMTLKVRNQIAGYIASSCVGAEETPIEETPQEES